MSSKEFILKSPNDIQALAKEVRDMVLDIGKVAKEGEKSDSIFITLQGDLGAGKTTFTKAFAEILGIEESITSPTFVILKKYLIKDQEIVDQAGFENIIHIDAYRLQDGTDLQKLNFEQYMQKNIICIEWPDIVADMLPQNRIAISFEHFPEPEHAEWRRVTVESKM